MKERPQNIESRYYAGTEPIPDTEFKIYTTSKDGMNFVYVGRIKVSGKLIAKEMHEHLSIKGYESQDIAEKLAHKRFKVNPIIVERIWGEEK